MNGEPAEITFTENGPADIAQLDALHRLIDWDKQVGARRKKLPRWASWRTWSVQGIFPSR